MTKEEKIEKVCKTMNKIYPNIEVMAEKIIDVLEESEERFLDYEICRNPGRGYGLAYMYLDENTEKIDPQILAATVGARIPGAKWAAVNDNRSMYFYTDEPDASYTNGCWLGTRCTNDFHDPYRIHCPVDDWSIAKWRLE